MSAIDEIAAERRIRCGDLVRHRPSGEEWLVAYADYETGDLAWAGWPDGIAKIADCELIEARNDQRHVECVGDWIGPIRSRRSDAVRRLYPEAVSEIERRDRAAGVPVDAGREGRDDEIAALKAEIGRLRAALRPFAKAGELFPPRGPGSYDEGVYLPAAGPEYAIGGDHLRQARATYEGRGATDAG